MTEKQKMLNGLWYDSRDSELIALYEQARKWTKEFNNLDAHLFDKKNEILKQLLGKIENRVWIESPFYCDYGKFIHIGSNTFINANCMFQDNNRIEVGANCLIGPSVQLYTAIHPISAKERIYKVDEYTRYHTKSLPISIGDNCWIGGNTTILPGVKIGDGVTIGAGSVVTKDLPSNVVAMGNPCKVYKQLEN